MATTKGGFRRTLTYKLSQVTDQATDVTQDLSGSSGRVFFVKVVGGSGDAYLKFYDTDPVVAGTTAPLFVLYAKASVTTEMFIPQGIPFTNSISIYANSTDGDGGTTAGFGSTINVTIVSN